MKRFLCLLIGCILTAEWSPGEEPKAASPGLLRYEKWTPDFPVPDPVALSFDPAGRAYVTQTRRRKANDLDIRRNMDWLVDDLRFETIDDKISFYREQFTVENSDRNKERVADHNGDGIHDLRDLEALSERVHRIEDTDGDGFADTSMVFAEQLDELIGGVAGGVLYHEGEIFVSPVPELVRFRDGDGDGKADERKGIVRGFGVHIAYAGHDMHGLAIGPDGRLYWSIGDKGASVSTPHGDYHFPNQGALFRCELDGTGFEVYARGLRNVQEAEFDDHGNWFGVDNDADGPGEKERFVHIEQYLDAGWRANWQYLRDDYNPWLDERMHEPHHEGQPIWFTPPLSNYENGPAGFKKNPGTALGPAYRDYFFLTSAPNGQQWAFRIEPRGDAFAMVDDHQIGDGIPLVGLAFAPDGALYGVDWGGGYPLNQNGAVWRIDVDERAADPRREETRKVIQSDFSSRGTGQLLELLELLDHPDRRVRLKAQFALVDRKDEESLTDLAMDPDEAQIARIHAIWGLGQLLRKVAAPRGEATLVGLFTDPDPEIRGQAVRTVTDGAPNKLGFAVAPEPAGEETPLMRSVLPLLRDPVLAVRMRALHALGRLGVPAAFPAVVELLAEQGNECEATYVRHAGVVALTGLARADQLEGLSSHESRFVRGCAVVALRRRANPGAAEFLSDPDSLVAAEAARAIYDDGMIPAAMPALAKSLGEQIENEAFTRRALAANHRLGTREAAARVTSFIASDEASESLLLAGIEVLETWTRPEPLDLVVGRYRALDERDGSILTAALAERIDELLLVSSPDVQTRAMALAREENLEIAAETLHRVVENKESDPGLRAEALRSLAGQSGGDLAALVNDRLDDEAEPVARAALELLAGIDEEMARSEIRRRVEGEMSLALRQHAIAQLPRASGREYLEGLLVALRDGRLDPGLQLDVLLAAGSPAFGEVRAIVEMREEIEEAWKAAAVADPLSPWRTTLVGGDPQRGESTFRNHVAAQCARCHKVGRGPGSDVGPNLKGIGEKRDRRYLLESLVAPQATVAKNYGTISVTRSDGSTVAGLFRGEKDGVLTIRDPEGKDVRVRAKNIEQRSPVVSTMPPMGLILTKQEIRDVIAYLAEL